MPAISMRIITCILFFGASLAIEHSDLTLIRIGQQKRVQSIITGQRHRDVQRIAERHADYQAHTQLLSHQGWNQRVAELRRRVPEVREWGEVVGASWIGQNMDEAAYEMYRIWRTSSDQWSIVNGQCDYYGYAMRRGDDDVWYACGIIGIK